MTDTIHPAAARGFAETADLYDRARPGYPDDALAMIVDRLDLRAGRTVLELGAGTGKLTRLLVPAGGRIVALEPVPGMRTKLTAALQDATLRANAASGPAPGLGAEGSSVMGFDSAGSFSNRCMEMIPSSFEGSS